MDNNIDLALKDATQKMKCVIKQSKTESANRTVEDMLQYLDNERNVWQHKAVLDGYTIANTRMIQEMVNSKRKLE